MGRVRKDPPDLASASHSGQVVRRICLTLLLGGCGPQIIELHPDGSTTGPGSTTGGWPPDDDWGDEGGHDPWCEPDTSAGDMSDTGPHCLVATGTGTGTGTGGGDVLPPSVQIVYPADGQWVPPGSSFTISAVASDDSCVDHLDLFIDGQFVVSSEDGMFSWEVTSIPEGTFELRVEAVDAAGNVGTSEPVVLQVRC